MIGNVNIPRGKVLGVHLCDIHVMMGTYGVGGHIGGHIEGYKGKILAYLEK